MKYQSNSEVIDDCLIYFIILWWVSHFGFEMWACYESDLVFIRRLPFNVNIYMVILNFYFRVKMFLVPSSI